jgi:hypothetical protein
MNQKYCDTSDKNSGEFSMKCQVTKCDEAANQFRVETFGNNAFEIQTNLCALHEINPELKNTWRIKNS